MLSFFKGLGIGLLCIVCFVIGVVFNTQFLNPKSSSGNGFIFTNELEASNKLTPDTFTSTPSFSASAILSTRTNLTSDEKASIAGAFNEILDRVAQDKLCRGGSYSIEPTFEYNNGLQIPKGQRFEASLTCEIKAEQLASYNTLLNDMDKIAGKSGFFTMSMPSLKAKFSKEQLVNNEKILSEELLKQALSEQERYSNLTAKACTLESLDLNTGNSHVPIFRSVALSASSAKADSTFENALPIVGEEDRSLSALVRYRCK
ncbi:hypothetical protein [Campylobacter sp. MIT 97-5078]|uniref:hypothetical protein n=1 Tax=Campylobacter sp. MIT 97-5078 TaxID=1548153 RepID=UPI000512DE5A|nr:hypothetical protein [Campylobacter sp. MIT 97-5078]KGI55786.1 hypothetical protein LR59_10535 [Campylobacter sp. MIT 97-5078]TQR27756.1 hypothetical protein DMB91_02235 [Campylobacter sp. MIT 97-5078]